MGFAATRQCKRQPIQCNDEVATMQLLHSRLWLPLGRPSLRWPARLLQPSLSVVRAVQQKPGRCARVLLRPYRYERKRTISQEVRTQVGPQWQNTEERRARLGRWLQ